MALNETDYLQKRIDFPNQRLMMLTGLWPYQRSSNRMLRVCLVHVILMIGILIQIRIFVTSDFEMNSVMELLQTLLPTFTFVSVYSNTSTNFTKVRSLMDRVRHKWDVTRNEDELKSMQKYWDESKFYSLIMTCFIYLYIIFLISPSLIHLLHFGDVTNDTKLITPLYMEYNVNAKLPYFSMLSFQCVVIITVCTVGIVYYSMHLSFVQHVCTLFDITMIKLDEPFKKNPDYFNWPCSDNKRGEYDWIVTVVKCYNDAINFMDLIRIICERTLGIEAALALLFTVVDMLYLLQLEDSMENMGEKLKNCIYIGSTLLVTFAYTHLGQKVIDHNDGIFVKCCQVPFYGLSPKTQKMLLLLIKSMRPCNFSLKGAIVVSHETFLSLLRTSFSYAMVFHNMK